MSLLPLLLLLVATASADTCVPSPVSISCSSSVQLSSPGVVELNCAAAINDSLPGNYRAELWVIDPTGNRVSSNSIPPAIGEYSVAVPVYAYTSGQWNVTILAWSNFAYIATTAVQITFTASTSTAATSAATTTTTTTTTTATSTSSTTGSTGSTTGSTTGPASNSCPASQTFYGPSGTFGSNPTSPTYTPSTHCEFLILGMGHVVAIYFSSINLETNYDTVSVYDGDSTNATRLLMLTGDVDSDSHLTYSSGDRLLVVFNSDLSVEFRGFVAVYNVTNMIPTGTAGGSTTSFPTSTPTSNSGGAITTGSGSTTAVGATTAAGPTTAVGSASTSGVASTTGSGGPSCPAFQEFFGPSGTFRSNPPGTTYTDNTHCQFLILGHGMYVVINFPLIDVELNYDYVEVYDGNSTSAPLLHSFTGRNTSNTVLTYSSSDVLLVVFNSDVSIDYSGFIANYTLSATSPSPPPNNNSCPAFQTFTGSNGTFSSNPPGTTYTANTRCEFHIHGSGSYVKLSFLRFDVEQPFDVVNIYDGDTVSNTLLVSLTGRNDTNPHITVSTGPMMLVVFISDHSVQYSGFQATFTSPIA